MGLLDISFMTIFTLKTVVSSWLSYVACSTCSKPSSTQCAPEAIKQNHLDSESVHAREVKTLGAVGELNCSL